MLTLTIVMVILMAISALFAFPVAVESLLRLWTLWKATHRPEESHQPGHVAGTDV